MDSVCLRSYCVCNVLPLFGEELPKLTQVLHNACLLYIPTGALFGASIGSSMGSKSAIDRARKEEMERLGVTQDMLDAARDCGAELERSNEGLRAVRDSLQTQQSFARRLDRDATDLYERAKIAMAENKDEEARKLLLERQRDQDKFKQVLMQCAEEKKRLEKMEQNVKAIERRAMEVDSLLRRTVGAKAVQEIATTDMEGLSLTAEDPLLQKFRDLDID
jgi:phage shock protein A